MKIITGQWLLMAACFLLTACGSPPVNAPVGTRGAPPKSVSPSRNAIRQILPGHYRVKKGDTLYSISWQHSLSFQRLAAMNRIQRPYTIYTGQQLRIKPAKAQAVISPLPVPPKIVATPIPKPATKPASKPAEKSANVTRPSAPPVVAKKLGNVAVKKWVWPVKGKLLRSYHPNAPGKKGIDISARQGTPVKAAAGGKVVYTGSGLVGYGQMVIIKHNDSLLSAYGHNSQLLVKEGDFVKIGQVISKVGSSGTHRSQLYFEIRKDGKPANPLRYLPRS